MSVFNRSFIYLACFVVMFAGCKDAEAQSRQMDQGDVAVTIYNDNFGVVKEMRPMEFAAGLNRMEFTDVAEAIDPTSVNFKCLSDPDGVAILEQNYEYDLVSADSLLKRYIDKQVQLRLKGSGSQSGTTVIGVLNAAVGGDMIVQSERGQMHIVPRNMIEQINLVDKPDELVTKPTLVWLAEAAKSGTENCQVTYTTERINWKADYSAVLAGDEKTLDLTGWVTVDNKSGAAYVDAKIKLIAGDVRRVEEPRRRYMMQDRVMALETKAGAGFEEKSFMDYHMYTLGRRSTIANNQVKQIEFISPARGVEVEKLYVYEWQKKSDKVQIKLEFVNSEDNKLGIALPKGKVRVFKADPADDSLEFVGEDAIDHTPKKEKISLYIGDAFDVVPEHKVVDADHGRRERTETHEVSLRNRKAEAVKIYVDHKVRPWSDWKVLKSNYSYEKTDSRTVRFTVELEADEEATLEFTVNEKWEF